MVPAHPGSTNSVVMRGLDPRIHLLKRISRSGWIAGSSPAMTATSVRDERSLAPFAGIYKHGFAISPRATREVWPARFALLIQRAQGMPDARCTRSLVCAIGSKYAHEYSQRVTGITRHSPRNGLRLIPCSPRRPAFLPPSLRGSIRKLDASVGASGPHVFAVR